MKSFTLKLLSLMLVCFMLLPLMLSCGEVEAPPSSSSTPVQDDEQSKFEALSESEKAFYILTTDFDDGGKQSVNLSMNLACKYMGYDVVAIMSGKMVEIDVDNTYVDYTETTMSLTMAGYSQVSTSKSGYLDGKQFTYVNVDGEENGEYAVYSKDKYIELFKQDEEEDFDDFGLTKDNCQTVTCAKNSQGNWVATFTDVTENGLEKFKELVSSFEGMISADDLVDVALTLTVSSNLKPMGVKVIFEFASGSNATLSLDATYAIGNDVVTPVVDFSNFNNTSNQ